MEGQAHHVWSPVCQPGTQMMCSKENPSSMKAYRISVRSSQALPRGSLGHSGTEEKGILGGRKESCREGNLRCARKVFSKDPEFDSTAFYSLYQEERGRMLGGNSAQNGKSLRLAGAGRGLRCNRAPSIPLSGSINTIIGHPAPWADRRGGACM